MIEIGFSKVTITPPLGTPLGGYEHRSKNAVAVHDDVYARCMLIHDSATQKAVALIVCDLLWVNYEFRNNIGQFVEKITHKRVKQEDVIVHAIHTHASQRILTETNFFYDRIKKPHNFQRNWYSKVGIPYLEYTIATSVYGALEDLQPAIIKGNFGTTMVGHNRRYHDSAAQIVDRELTGFFCLKRNQAPDGDNVRAIFYNLGAHCVALGEQNYYISQDWPYWTQKLLKKTYHYPWNTVTFFGQAPAGNINPWNCRFNEEERNMREAKKVGQEVAADVIRTLREETLIDFLSSEDSNPFQRLQTTIKIPITIPEKIKLYRELNLWRLGIIEEDGNLFLKVRINLVRLGKLVIVTTPGEPFSEFSVRIKESIRKKDNNFIPIVLELTDGAVGYITTRESFYQKEGYEQSLSASPDTGYEIVKAVDKMLEVIFS